MSFRFDNSFFKETPSYTPPHLKHLVPEPEVSGHDWVFYDCWVMCLKCRLQLIDPINRSGTSYLWEPTNGSIGMFGLNTSSICKVSCAELENILKSRLTVRNKHTHSWVVKTCHTVRCEKCNIQYNSANSEKCSQVIMKKALE